MNDLYEVHEIESGDILVWLDKSGDCVWIKTCEPYNSWAEMSDKEAVRLANILISLAQSRRCDPITTHGTSCITKGDKGSGRYYELPDSKVIIHEEGCPVIIQTKYPDNVPIQLTLQEAFEFGRKLIDITRKSIEEHNEWMRNDTFAQENP